MCLPGIGCSLLLIYQGVYLIDSTYPVDVLRTYLIDTYTGVVRIFQNITLLILRVLKNSAIPRLS